MRAKKTVWLVLAAFAVLSYAGIAHAQSEWQVAGFNLQGDVIAGGRVLIEEPSKTRRAKFEEYRDISDGAFLDGLHLRLFRPDESYSVEMDGEKWGNQDQSFGLGAGRLGLWDFRFEWDQTPHILSTDGRTLEREVAPGKWTLPTPRPALSSFNNAPFIDEIGFRTDTARMGFVLTPTPDIDIRMEYTRTHKDGTKPFSMVFGSSPGFNFVEVLAPVDQTIHDVRLRGTIARENWQLQVGYVFSMFDNGNNSVTADNPCFGQAASSPCGASNTARATTPNAGVAALEPDNMAHTFFLQGGASLPLRTRVTGNFSYGIQLQNDPFLAQTSNPLALADPNAATLLALPRRSLEGDVRTTMFNVGVNSRPLNPLTLNLKYRYYDLSDKTPTAGFPEFVVGDRPTLPLAASEEEVAVRDEFTRHNLDADARFRVMQPLAVTLGAGWERMNRSASREVERSDEVFAKAAVDATPFDWLLARVTYRPSFRRTGRYNPNAKAEESFPSATPDFLEEEAATGSHPLARRFDEAERNRQKVDVLLQFTPLDTLSFGPQFSWRDDDYIESVFGLQRETAFSAGFDVNWTPIERVAFTAGYTHEVNFQKMRSRNRPVVGETTIFDFPDYDWISDMTDTVDTIFLNGTVRLIPRVLDWSAGVSFSTATGTTDNRNPNGVPHSLAPGLAATAPASAQASPWPAFSDELIRIDTALRFHFWKVWTASLGYAFESYTQTDWRTGTLNPFIGQDSIWLGNNIKSYTAHIVAVTVAYHF